MRFVFLLYAAAAFAQTPLHYTCHRTSTPINIDGNLDDPAWQSAPWTEDFVDIQGAGQPKPRYRTRAKMLWDDRYFYIAAELEEPHVWATLTAHDSVIFHENDFEVFSIPRVTHSITLNSRSTPLTHPGTFSCRNLTSRAAMRITVGTFPAC
ncbi:MAG: carbohydrate-binding family 9-like protein [Ignavibacteriota bacterium]